MAQQGRPSREEDRRQFLGLVPKDGATIGNYNLMSQLGWKDERYWNVRDALVDDGVVVLGRGRGGTVRLAQAQAQTVASRPPAVVEPQSQPPREIDHYDSLEVGLSGWIKQKNFTHAALERTALQGARKTGGTWTRPDFTLATNKKFHLIGQNEFDLWTFEVKLADETDVRVVYEALAHRRRSTRAVVLIIGELDEEVLNVVEEEAARQGIGLLIAHDPKDAASWEEKLTAERFAASYDNIENYLRTSCNKIKEELQTWGTRVI